MNRKEDRSNTDFYPLSVACQSLFSTSLDIM
jgi:hypothetical protein